MAPKLLSYRHECGGPFKENTYRYQIYGKISTVLMDANHTVEWLNKDVPSFKKFAVVLVEGRTFFPKVSRIVLIEALS